jgi:anti-sigma factor RsiW
VSTHPPVQDLEAIVAGSLDEERSILLTAHTDDCPLCTRELAWLRAERELFEKRARGVPPSEAWSQIVPAMRLATRFSICRNVASYSSNRKPKFMKA